MALQLIYLMFGKLLGWLVLRTQSDGHRDPGAAPPTRRAPTMHASPADDVDRPALIACGVHKLDYVR
jgi:hypothetical protein